jgi:hypothetical protein
VPKRCNSKTSAYCLLDLKRDDKDHYSDESNIGFNTIDLRVSKGIVTYSLQNENGLITPKRQISVRSEFLDFLINSGELVLYNTFLIGSDMADIKDKTNHSNPILNFLYLLWIKVAMVFLIPTWKNAPH